MINAPVTLRDITWGGRIRPRYKSLVWGIAKKAATERRKSIYGSMVCSQERTTLSLLDGMVTSAGGFFDASSGMRWDGLLTKAYILYEMGLDPAVLLKARGLPSHAELQARVARELAAAAAAAETASAGDSP
jgi:hypothetical protein